MLATSVSVRDIQSGTTDSVLCASVLQAVEYGMQTLLDRPETTAVVVIGEEDGAGDAEAAVNARSAGLAASLAQPGLFLTLAAQDIVRDRLMSDVRFEDFG